MRRNDFVKYKEPQEGIRRIAYCYSNEDYDNLRKYWASQNTVYTHNPNGTSEPIRPEVKESSHRIKHEYYVDEDGKMQGDAIMYSSDGKIHFSVKYKDDKPIQGNTIENNNGYPHQYKLFEKEGKICVCYSTSMQSPGVTFDSQAPFIKDIIPATGCIIGVLT